MNAKVTTNKTPAQPTVADLISVAVTAYATATGSDKVKVRNRADEAAKAALRAGNLLDAQAWQNAADGMVATSAKKAVEIDWTARLVDRAASLVYAAELMFAQATLPTGVPDDAKIDWDGFGDKVKARVAAAWSATTDDEARTVTDAGQSIASEKVGRSVVRNDIQSVIDRAFDGLDKGTFLTVAEIATKGGTADYRPSDGAIAARVAWTKGLTTTLTGVVPVDAVGTVARGFTKA